MSSPGGMGFKDNIPSSDSEKAVTQSGSEAVVTSVSSSEGKSKPGWCDLEQEARADSGFVGVCEVVVEAWSAPGLSVLLGMHTENLSAG